MERVTPQHELWEERRRRARAVIGNYIPRGHGREIDIHAHSIWNHPAPSAEHMRQLELARPVVYMTPSRLVP